MGMLISQGISAAKVVASLGVNTHLDFKGYGYENVNNVVDAINYLGVKNLRDSPNKPTDIGATGIWQQIADGTGAKFDAYLNQGSTATDIAGLANIVKLAGQGIINFIEGGNENDSAYSISLGNSIAWTANYQQTVYATGQLLGIPVINMSFGAGWTAANNWVGNYDKVGDMSPYADYGNAHTYPNLGQGTDTTMERLNSDALLAAKSRPVITTEIGWDNRTHSQADTARYVLQAAFDGMENGNAKTYFYSLYDDGSGKFGLMNADGTAKPAGEALHNLTTILADTGTTVRTDFLAYGLTGTTANDHTLLMEKSNGVFQLALWNESKDAAHSITLNLGATAGAIRLYDPLTGSQIVQSIANSKTFTITLGNSPVIVEIVPVGVNPNAAVAQPAAGQTVVVPPAPTPQTVYAKDGDQVSILDGVNTVYLLGSNGSVVAQAGANTLYTNGGNNVLTGGKGDDKIQAFGSNNTLTGGAGNDSYQLSGSNNVVYLGAGADTVRDSGINNRIVFGKANEGTADIYGYVLTNGDVFDLRNTLAATTWTKDPATLANYLKVTMSGNSAILSIDADGLGAGDAVRLATLQSSGTVTMSTLLAHSLVA